MHGHLWISLTSLKRFPPTSSVHVRRQWLIPSIFALKKVWNSQGFTLTGPDSDPSLHGRMICRIHIHCLLFEHCFLFEHGPFIKEIRYMYIRRSFQAGQRHPLFHLSTLWSHDYKEGGITRYPSPLAGSMPWSLGGPQMPMHHTCQRHLGGWEGSGSHPLCLLSKRRE